MSERIGIPVDLKPADETESKFPCAFGGDPKAPFCIRWDFAGLDVGLVYDWLCEEEPSLAKSCIVDTRNELVTPVSSIAEAKRLRRLLNAKFASWDLLLDDYNHPLFSSSLKIHGTKEEWADWSEGFDDSSLSLVGMTHLKIDLSQFTEEVIDYLCDQLPDRISELSEHEFELHRTGSVLEFSIPVMDLLFKIIEEKEADIEYEIRKGERPGWLNPGITETLESLRDRATQLRETMVSPHTQYLQLLEEIQEQVDPERKRFAAMEDQLHAEQHSPDPAGVLEFYIAIINEVLGIT